jgi:hypothetical protein
MAVGLEIVDVGRPPDDLEGTIAASVAHRACVLGPTRPAGPSAPGVARTWINGALRQSAGPPEDCAQTLAELALVLAAAGLGLQAGDRVLAGSLTHVVAGAGDHVVAEIDHLGRVEARLTDQVLGERSRRGPSSARPPRRERRSCWAGATLLASPNRRASPARRDRLRSGPADRWGAPCWAMPWFRPWTAPSPGS